MVLERLVHDSRRLLAPGLVRRPFGLMHAKATPAAYSSRFLVVCREAIGLHTQWQPLQTQYLHHSRASYIVEPQQLVLAARQDPGTKAQRVYWALFQLQTNGLATLQSGKYRRLMYTPNVTSADLADMIQQELKDMYSDEPDLARLLERDGILFGASVPSDSAEVDTFTIPGDAQLMIAKLPTFELNGASFMQVLPTAEWAQEHNVCIALIPSSSGTNKMKPVTALPTGTNEAVGASGRSPSKTIKDLLDALVIEYNCENTPRNRFVQPQLDGIARVIPQNRKLTWNSMRAFALTAVASAHDPHRNLQRDSIPLITGYSKFGKTFTALGINQHVLQPLREDPDYGDIHFEYLLVTFNHQTNLNNCESAFSMETIVAWRLFFTYFLDGHQPLWRQFVERLIKHEPAAFHLNLSNVISRLVDDIQVRHPNKKIVITLVIDEFQHTNIILADPAEVGRVSPEYKLKSPVRILVGALRDLRHPKASILPILVGLRRRDALKENMSLSMRQLVHFQLPPLAFEDAMMMIVESNRAQLLRLPAVQNTLFQYSAVPGVIAGLLNHLAITLPKDPKLKVDEAFLDAAWAALSCEHFEKFSTPVRSFSDHTLFSLVIPHALAREPLTHDEVAELEEVCQAFWSHPSGNGVHFIRIPAVYLFLLNDAYKPDPDKEPAWSALKKAARMLRVSETADWQQLDNLIACNFGLVFNAFLCLPTPQQCVPVKRLFPGAIISQALANRRAYLKPLQLERSLTHLTKLVDRLPKGVKGAKISGGAGVQHDLVQNLFGGDYVHVCGKSQEAIDVITVIKIDDPVRAGRHVALLVGVQSKLEAMSGLTPATYRKSAGYMRSLVQGHETSIRALFPGCDFVGFLLGIVDPIQACSDEVKEFIHTKSCPEKLEFYFAVGRAEVREYFGPLADHPVLVPRLFINQTDLDPNRLAMFLPSEWANRRKLAELIIKHRKASGQDIKDWSELTTLAQKLEDERVQTHNQKVQEATNSLSSKPGKFITADILVAPDSLGDVILFY